MRIIMNQPLSIAIFVAIGLASIASYLTGYGGLKVSIISTVLYLIALAILCISLKNILSDYFGNSVIYAVIGIFFVMSFFPILNHVALSVSTPVMHQVTNWLGQKSYEVSPVDISVFWGTGYAKTLYIVLGGIIGYLIGKED